MFMLKPQSLDVAELIVALCEECSYNILPLPDDAKIWASRENAEEWALNSTDPQGPPFPGTRAAEEWATKSGSGWRHLVCYARGVTLSWDDQLNVTFFPDNKEWLVECGIYERPRILEFLERERIVWTDPDEGWVPRGDGEESPYSVNLSDEEFDREIGGGPVDQLEFRAPLNLGGMLLSDNFGSLPRPAEVSAWLTSAGAKEFVEIRAAECVGQTSEWPPTHMELYENGVTLVTSNSSRAVTYFPKEERWLVDFGGSRVAAWGLIQTLKRHGLTYSLPNNFWLKEWACPIDQETYARYEEELRNAATKVGELIDSNLVTIAEGRMSFLSLDGSPEESRFHRHCGSLDREAYAKRDYPPRTRIEKDTPLAVRRAFDFSANLEYHLEREGEWVNRYLQSEEIKRFDALYNLWYEIRALGYKDDLTPEDRAKVIDLINWVAS